MSSTNLPDPDLIRHFPQQPTAGDRRILIEEIACAIAEAQAALFAGRIQDFENCIRRQQDLCADWKRLHPGPLNSIASNAENDEVIQAAQRVRRQNLLFGAVVRRMRRHLETLRNLLNGPSHTYQPQPAKAPGREG